MIVIIDPQKDKTPDVVVKKLPEGKLCPTQYNSETKRVEVDPSYGLNNGDPCEWIYHEYVHHYVETNCRHYKKEEDTAEYPTNQIEKTAYTSQFVRLQEKLITLEKIFTDDKYKTLKDNFLRYPYLYNYWELACIYLSEKDICRRIRTALNELSEED